MYQNKPCSCGSCSCGCNAPAATAALELAQAGFALLDLTLYLDTHPTDQNALCYFAKKKEQYEQARRAYREQIGPVTPLCVDPAEGWTWGDTPWPWEV